MKQHETGPMENLLEGLSQHSHLLSQKERKEELRRRGIDVEAFLNEAHAIIARHQKESQLAGMTAPKLPRQRVLHRLQKKPRSAYVRKESINPEPVQSVLPPPTSRPERLPLDDANIDWSRFEAFSRDFVSKLDRVVRCFHYGTQGSKQNGIDLVAELADGERWTFQCRQWRKFSKASAEKTVHDTKYRAAKHFILVSCEVDTSVRDFIAKTPKWELWDVRDISHQVGQLAQEKARDLVERHFGPDWRKLFLGLGPLSPFLSPNVFFQRWLRPERLFNHSWAQVGRADIICDLERFAASSSSRIGLLIGRGGIGKTKLLCTFSDAFQLKHPDTLLWFVQEDVLITPAALDELPLRPALIVVDDAHRREDLALLLAHVNRSSQPLKLLFSFRPRGTETLQSLLSRAGFDPTEIRLFPEMKQLPREDIRSLARQALGAPMEDLVEQLSSATWDCPLVTVVGGRLLAQRAIDPRLLERSADFQRAVLDRFEDELIGPVGTESPVLYRELLKLVAATAPIPSDDKAFVDSAAAFVGSTPETIILVLGKLETIGILLRRGRTLRISPDVLSDHLLAKACRAENGVPTGYAERVFKAFSSSRPARVLGNLAELDWRMELTSGGRANLLASIWRQIEDEFRRTDWTGRCQLLGIIEEAAYFQPGQALRIAEIALSLSRDKIRKVRRQTLLDLTQEDVLHDLPKILRRVAFSMEHLAASCHLLWSLGRNDERPLNPFPEHAIRVLQDLASYETRKPASFNRIILDCIADWLRDPRAHEYAHSPLCVLDKLLERGGDTTRTEGVRLIISPFLINPQTTKSIRDRAIEALGGCAQSGKPKIIVRVLESLRRLLHDDFRMARGLATAEYTSGWLPEKMRALREIRRLAGETQQPIVHWKVLEVLDWPCHEASSKAVRDEALAIIRSVPDTFELRLIRSLLSEPLVPRPRRGPPSKDHQAWKRKLEADELERTNFRASVAQECVHRYRTGRSIAKSLAGWLRELEAAGCSTWPNHLLAEIAHRYPKPSLGLCRAIVASPQSPLAGYFHVLAGTLRAHAPAAVTDLIEKASRTKASKLLFSVAQHFWFANRDSTPASRESKVLKRLIRHSAPHVARLAIQSLQYLGQHNSEMALALLLDTDLNSSSAKAAALCECFHRQYGIDPSKLSDRHINQILQRLIPVDDIEDHWIQGFLSYVTTRMPLAVIDLLLKRIAYSLRCQGIEYRPIPWNSQISFSHLKDHSDYLTVLRRVRDLALRKSWRYRHRAVDLYWMLVADPRGLDVIREWLESGDIQKIKAAAGFLEKAGPNFVFERPDFVHLALERAHAAGEDCYRFMRANLDSSATSGSKSGTPGQPMPRDLEIRDRSAQLAQQFAANPIVGRFYEAMRRAAEADIQRDRDEYEETFGGE